MPTAQNLVLRGAKGAPLTWQEVDDNFQLLLESANGTVDVSTFTVLEETVNNNYLVLQGEVEDLQDQKYDTGDLASSQQATGGSLATPGSINNTVLMTPYTVALAIDQRVNPAGIGTSITNLENTKYDSGDLASEQQATTGTSNTVLMTPLSTAQAIDNRINPTVQNSLSALNTSVTNIENNKYDSGDIATEQQAREGFLTVPDSINNTTLMTPLRVAQAIDERASKLTIGLVLALGG